MELSIMISFISGILYKKNKESIIVDCRGIGYEILVPANFLYSSKLIESEPIHIDTYLHVREDIMELYGFESSIQKQVFLYLIKVSGISCKNAIKILSTYSTEEIILAVKEGNKKKLVTIPGLGKKTAEKLILELKDNFIKQFTNIYETKSKEKETLSSNVMDAMEGLLALGFTQTEVKNVMSKLDENILNKNTEIIIKECLSKLTN
jgi:holliday junction DNA helicase RuvA